MWLLIGISCVLGLLVLVPTAIEAAAMRKRCPQCRYDLEGLDRHGVCPECGGVYDKATIAVVGWEFRWRVVPKILLAMLAPAMGPILFVHGYALLLQRHYGWSWEAAVYQASERDLVGVAAVLSVPLLVNSWLVVGVPSTDSRGRRRMNDRMERPGFWARLITTTVVGTVTAASFSIIPLLDRLYFDATLLLVLAFMLLVVVLGAIHVVLERHFRRGKQERPPEN